MRKRKQGKGVMHVTVICDASFCPETNAGGWAGWCSSDLGINKLSMQFRSIPNSVIESEYWAIENSLWIARSITEFSRILVYNDNLAAIKKYMRTISPGGEQLVVLKHIKAHINDGSSKHYVHNWCDRAARARMREMRNQIT